MARFGPFFTYWSRNWKVDLYDVIKKIADAGGTCTEIHTYLFEAWPAEKRMDFVKYARDLNVEFAHWTGFPDGIDPSSEDASIRAEAVRHTIGQLKLAASMGGKLLDGTYAQAWNVPLRNPGERARAVDRSVEVMKEVAKAAEDYDILLSLEILNRFEGALVNTGREAMDILDRVGSDQFRITLDNFHMNIEEDSIEDTIETIKTRMGHAHLGEANRKLPGLGGQMDWDKLLGGMRKVGYDGMFVFEAFVLHGGDVADGVKLWRDLSDGASEAQMSERLATSIKFVQNKFEGK